MAVMKIPAQKHLLWILIFALFLSLRLLLLHTNFESCVWTEELYRGTIAREIIDGPKTFLLNYQADGYDGGSLVMGIAAVPFFLLLGPSYFALKCAGLLFSFITLAGIILLFCRFFGFAHAITAALLYTFAPPTFFKLGLVTIGSHPESTAFSIFMLYFFYALTASERPKTAPILGLGLSAGLGCWFTSITGITVITLLISWPLMHPKKISRTQLMILAAAFLAGTIPWWIYNAQHEWSGAAFVQHAFDWRHSGLPLAVKLKTVIVKIIRIFTDTLPFCFGFRNTGLWPGAVTSLIYYLFLLTGYCTAWISALSRKNSGREGALFIPWLLYPIVFTFCYSISHYGLFSARDFLLDFVAYKYFSPMFFFLLLASALPIRGRIAFRWIPGILCLLGIAGVSSSLFQNPSGLGQTYQGYSYYDLGRVWGQQMSPFPEKAELFHSLASNYDAKTQRLLYWGYAESLDGTAPGEADKVIAGLRQLDASRRKYFAEMLGSFLSSYKPEDADFLKIHQEIPASEQEAFLFGYVMGTAVDMRNSTAQTALEDIQKTPFPDKKFFFWDWGRSIFHFYYGAWTHHPESNVLELIRSLPASEKGWALRGLGYGAVADWVYGSEPVSSPQTAIRLCSKLSESELEFFYWGIGWALAEENPEDSNRRSFWANQLPRTASPSIFQGVRDFESWYNNEA